MDQEYVLKSTKEDIAAAIKRTGIFFFEEADESAKVILEYCPKILHQNIDEIVNGLTPTNIYFEIETSGGVFTETVSSICDDFYNKLPFIAIILGVCLEIRDGSGFDWLNSFFQ